MAAPGSAQKSEEEWRAILSPEQFRILRQKGTEYVFFCDLIQLFGCCYVRCLLHLILSFFWDVFCSSGFLVEDRKFRSLNVIVVF